MTKFSEPNAFDAIYIYIYIYIYFSATIRRVDRVPAMHELSPVTSSLHSRITLNDVIIVPVRERRPLHTWASPASSTSSSGVWTSTLIAERSSLTSVSSSATSRGSLRHRCTVSTTSSAVASMQQLFRCLQLLRMHRQQLRRQRLQLMKPLRATSSVRSTGTGRRSTRCRSSVYE